MAVKFNAIESHKLCTGMKGGLLWPFPQTLHQRERGLGGGGGFSTVLPTPKLLVPINPPDLKIFWLSTLRLHQPPWYTLEDPISF